MSRRRLRVPLPGNPVASAALLSALALVSSATEAAAAGSPSRLALGYEGDTGLFHVPAAWPIREGTATIGVFRDNLDRDPKDVDVSIHGVNGVYGLRPDLQVFGQVGLQHRINTDASFQSGFPNDFPFAGTVTSQPSWQTGFGDVRIGLKYTLARFGPADSATFAARVEVKLPTADDRKGLGTGKLSVGSDLVMSASLGSRAELHARLGYEYNGDPVGLDLANAFRWGAGLMIGSAAVIAMQFELNGKVYTGASFDQTNVIDVVVGPVIWLGDHVFLRPAVSWNFAFDDRGLGSSTRSFTGRHIAVGFTFARSKPETTVAPPPPPPPPANDPPVILLNCRSPIEAGEASLCKAAASDPEGDILTLSWTADRGRIIPGDGEAKYDSTGVPCPSRVLVRVRVQDARGATAVAEQQIEVRCRTPVVAPGGALFQPEEPFVLLDVDDPGALPAGVPDYCRTPDRLIGRLTQVTGGPCTLEARVETRLGPPPAQNTRTLYCPLRVVGNCRYIYRAYVWAETSEGTLGFRVLRQGWVFKNCGGDLTEPDTYDMPEIGKIEAQWRQILNACRGQ